MAPKIKDTDNPLHKLWKSTGYTHEKFAQMLGVTVHQLRNLINPDRPGVVDEDFAIRLSAVFGVGRQCIRQSEGPLLDHEGNEYNAATWKRLLAGIEEAAFADKDKFMSVLKEVILDVIEESFERHTHPRHRADAVVCLLEGMARAAHRTDFEMPKAEKLIWKFSDLLNPHEGD